MRYRKLSPTGDYTFGQQQANFWTNVPDGVAQAVSTRLKLWRGQWFLDTTEGTDWQGKVLGNRTALTRDVELQQRVLSTPGATQINNYSSSFDPNTRDFAASFQLDTQYGTYAGQQTGYITPSSIAQPQPPAKPTSIVVTTLSDTSVSVTWTPYVVPAYVPPPAPTRALIAGQGTVHADSQIIPGVPSGTSQILGTASVTAHAQVIANASARISGQGSVTGKAVQKATARATISGAGSMTVQTQTTATGVQAIPANTFLNSTGIGVHIDQGFGATGATSYYIPELQYTGLRNFRSGVGQLSTVQIVCSETGAKAMINCHGTDIPSTVTFLKTLAQAGQLVALEGPNELNNFPITYNGQQGGGSGSWLPAAQYQRDLYAAKAGDSVLHAYPLFAAGEPGAQTTNSGLQWLTTPNPSGNAGLPDWIGDGVQLADYAEVHNYVSSNQNVYVDNQAWSAADGTGGGLAFDTIQGNFTGTTWLKGYACAPASESNTIPRVTTETGWDSSAPVTGNSTQLQGKMLVKTLLAQFKRGWAYTFIYEMIDAEGSSQNQGLYTANPTRAAKPAATYIHNLTTILADTLDFAAGKLNYSIPSQPSTVHDLLLQKASGRFYLVIWGESVSGSNTITVNLGQSFNSVNVYDTTVGTSPTATNTNVSSVSLTVSDHALIVEAFNSNNQSVSDGSTYVVPMQAKALYYLPSPPIVGAVAAAANLYDVKIIEPSTDGGVSNVFVSVSDTASMRGSLGHPVLCYHDIGACEPDRYYFASIQAAGVCSTTADQWGEFPVRFWDPAWYAVLQGYIDKAIAAGFDGMYYDVIDNWQNAFVGGATSTNAQHMIQLLYDMRQYAHVTKGKPSFRFWVNGGEELMDYGSFPTIGSYINNVDGFLKEEVLYHSTNNTTVRAYNTSNRNAEYAYFDQATAAGKPVCLVEYVGNGSGTGTTCTGSNNQQVSVYPVVTGGSPNIATAIADVKNTCATKNYGHFIAYANYPNPPLDFVNVAENAT